MIKRDLSITNNLDPGPASKFAKVANQFQSKVCLEKGGHKVNGKSIMGLMELANHPGEILTISVEGDDASQAMETLSSILKNPRSRV